MKQDPRCDGSVSPSRVQLDRFCALVLARPCLQEQLSEPDDMERFVALVLQVGRQHGFTLTTEDIWAVMRNRMLGIDALFDDGASETQPPPPGWLPTQAFWRGGELHVRWLKFGAAPLREPFFESDVRRQLRKPFNRMFNHLTPITGLGGWLTAHPGLPPTGLIFHMSRCGSTLVSQMLAALAHSIAISEASPIDAVVQARYERPDLSSDRNAEWLAWMVGALSQPRRRVERNCFIKLDSWHTAALPLFQRAFPSVPWVFLYRDPVEVLVSQLHMPGTQMIPGALTPVALELADTYQPQMREDYIARVLAKICEPVVRHYCEGGGLLVHYSELPDAVWTRILPHFGVACSESDRAAMVMAARYNAKMPGVEFARDVEAKQQAATEATHAAADAHLGDLYSRLEALRLGT